MKGILGKKIGMTQIFTEHGEVIPVTVVEAGPVVVTQIKTTENDGYTAIQVGFLQLRIIHAHSLQHRIQHLIILFHQHFVLVYLICLILAL